MDFVIGNISCSGWTTNIEKKIANEYEGKGLIEVIATLLTNKLWVKIHTDGKIHFHFSLI